MGSSMIGVKNDPFAFYPRFCVWIYPLLLHASLMALSIVLIVVLELFLNRSVQTLHLAAFAEC